MNIEQIRETCLALAGTSEAVKYGDQLCFMVVGKHFCTSNLKQMDKVNLKAKDDEFEMLCEKTGISPAPYGGAKYKWIQVEHFDVLTDREWEALIHSAYDTVKAKLPKKVQQSLQ